MSPQRIAVLGVLCATLVLGGWVAAGLVGFGSRSIEDDGARIAIDTTAITENSVDGVAIVAMIDTAFSDLAQMPSPARIASASTPDPAHRAVEASAQPF